MKKTLIFNMLLAVVMLSSCTKEIEYTLDEGQSRIVIDGTITNEKKAHKVRITRTSNYLSKAANAPVSGALVSISDGSNFFTLKEIIDGSGEYFTDSDVQGEEGKTYTLTVKVDDTEYTSTTYMNKVVTLDSIYVFQLLQKVPFKEETDSSYTILMYAQEPPELGNYFTIIYFINDVLITDSLREVGYADDAVVNGTYFADYPTFDINNKNLKPNDKVTLQLLSVDKNYYAFIDGVMRETEYKGGMFDGPPANVKGNISNGAMGFFNASAVSAKSFVMP